MHSAKQTCLDYRGLHKGYVRGPSEGMMPQIGLLLTRTHNQRTLALQEDIENRKLTYQAEVDKRLALDTVVKGLELISADGSLCTTSSDRRSPRRACTFGVIQL